MLKLNPPIIEGTIPAFFAEGKTATIKIPYAMNKAVSFAEISGFSLKIKTVQSNRIIADIDSSQYSDSEVEFTLGETILQNMNVSQFYKIQLAYKSIDKTVGFYSTVGIVKFTSKPEVTILSSTDGTTFTGCYSQKEKDISEKVYTYRFDVFDSIGNLFETSGEQLHNNSFDTEIYESIDRFTLVKELEKNKVYYLTYTVTTINDLVVPSASFRLTKTDSIDSKLRTDLLVELDYENGYVDLRLAKPIEDAVEEPAVGSFILVRASDEDNYSSWNEVLKFVLYGQQPSRHLWRDMTVKQGVSYKYAIQQYNEHGLKSNKIESKVVLNNGDRVHQPVFVDFEHAFLFDGKRQLKIKYNPKVSSFKNVLLESKVDTIGSKHPFIFRNGNVKYKEFPISGMISYLSDENNLFYDTSELTHLEERPDNKHNQILVVETAVSKEKYLKNFSTYYVKEIVLNRDEEVISEYMTPWDKYMQKYYPNIFVLDWDKIESELNKLIRNRVVYENLRHQEYIKYSTDKVRTTNLTSNNIYVERNFKLEVLEWLTNGEPKLFRSPSEGNYLVRLLNVSLSPEDTLGRMLHTFSGTAYEIADYSYNNMSKFNIIATNNPTNKQLRWETVEFQHNSIEDNQNVLRYPASALRFEGMIPGDKIWIDDGIKRNGNSKPGFDIVIGVTGSYIVDLKNNVTINSVTFSGSPDYLKDESGGIRHQGVLTYAYYTSDFKDSFDTVESIITEPVPSRQFIGYYEDIIKAIDNKKHQLSSIGYIRFYLRDSDEELCLINDKYYMAKKTYDGIQAGDEITPQASTSLFKVYTEQIDGNYFNPEVYIYYDGYNKKEIFMPENDHSATTIIFNGNSEVDLWDIYKYELRLPTNISSIKIGDAIICEITYQSKNIIYDFEVEKENEPPISDEVKAVREKYQEYIEYRGDIKESKDSPYETLMKNKAATAAQLVEAEQKCVEYYSAFLEALDIAIASAERR